MKLTLTQRLSVVFALLLLVCCGTSAWLQVRANRMHELEVVQGLSRDLASHIASNGQLMDTNGLKSDAVRQLFGQLMAVNPSVEVYLLDTQGRIVGHAAPLWRMKREQVDLAPVQRFLNGDILPILGDDPRSIDGRKVFSAAPLRVNGTDTGYIYVVLLGEAHDRFAVRGATSEALNIALWSIGLVALLCLLAGLTAFAWITQPLRDLTVTVGQFDIDNYNAALPPPTEPHGNDEIAVLDAAFRQMATCLSEQWRALPLKKAPAEELEAYRSRILQLSVIAGPAGLPQVSSAQVTSYFVLEGRTDNVTIEIK